MLESFPLPWGVRKSYFGETRPIPATCLRGIGIILQSAYAHIDHIGWWLWDPVHWLCDEASIHLPNLVGEEGDVTRCGDALPNCVWMTILVEGSWWYGCEKLWTCCYTFSEDVAALVLCTFPAAGTDTFGRGKICECWEMLLLCFNMRANRRRRKQSSFSRNARRMILVLTSCRHNIWYRVYDLSGPGPAWHDPVHCTSFILPRRICRSSVSLY